MQERLVLDPKNLKAFQEWCASKNIQMKAHPSIMHSGYLVKQGKHWMGILWNRSFSNYTMDKRLETIYVEFHNQLKK